jgi:hypothetical protein
MPTQRYQIPKAQSQVIDPKTGALTQEWFLFFADMSTRVATNIPELAGASTLAQTISAFNDLREALIASSQMEPD